MKKIISLLVFTLLFSSLIAQTELYNRLKNISGVVSVKEMEIKPFSEYYELYFKQYIDHQDTSKGTFNQRVLLGHVGIENPMIVELQGYNIWTPKQGELSNLLNGNQLTIEHRFFKDSKPKGKLPWNDLNVRNAAEDQHIIIEAIKSIYNNKWISTGISKGGQTTIIHRYFYPNDVDISVPYVAPHNLTREDPRIHKFLNSVGTKECRDKILKFQLLCFENIDKMMPFMEALCKSKDYTFVEVGGARRALELTILEYSFAFWQWGSVKEENIPSNSDDIKYLFDHLVRYGDPGFFEDASIEFQRPYFWAAMTEMGIYDYDITPFKKYLKDTKNITFKHTMPKGFENTPFDGTIMNKINKWLQTNASKMMFIYGGLDTWGATGVDLGNNTKCVKYIHPNGHHGTRIKNFDNKTKEEIIAKIRDWMR